MIFSSEQGCNIIPISCQGVRKPQMISSFMSQVKNHPVKVQPPEQPGSVILSEEQTLQVSFFFQR